MILDGISASQHLDSSGEVLNIKNHDISDLEEGRGVLNWEHNNDSSEDIIGAIIYAKKIMNKSDCANDRERMYWKACGTPFVYIKAELFDDVEHPGAVAAAAMIRYYHRKKEKILAGFSIEGSTLERTDNYLERSVGRRVALTLRPCNKSAISGVYEDQKDENFKKFMNIADSSNIRTVDVDTFIFEDIEKAEKTERECLNDLKKAIKELRKTLTAGSYDVAPSMLSGGSALQTEHRVNRQAGLPVGLKNKLKRAVASWDKKRPLRDVIKAAMPEVSDEYVDHFTALAEDLSLKKGMKPPVRIDPHHSWNINMNDKQRKLISGLYINTEPAARPAFVGSEPSRNEMNQLKNDEGQKVIIKHPDTFTDHEHDPASASSAYYRMASDFFGLGDHVPVTNHFTHSAVNKDSKHIQAQELVEGAHTPYDREWASTLKAAKEDGSAHKLAVMDMILGADHDRHYGNMLGKDGKIINVDNDDAMRYEGSTTYPSHFDDFQDVEGNSEDGIGKDLMHVDAVRWLSGLDPRELVRHFLKSGMDKSKALTAAYRLKTLQDQSSGKSLYEMHDMINPKKKSRVAE